MDFALPTRVSIEKMTYEQPMSSLSYAPTLSSVLSPVPSASVFACMSILANTILGAGILGLPHAFAVSGPVLGIVLILLGAAFAAFALHLLAVCCAKLGTRPASFYTVTEAAMPKAAMLVDAAVMIKCFGVATSYLIVIGDLMPAAITMWIVPRQVWITVFVVAVALPLACLRSLNALRFTAAISIGFVIAFVTTIIACDLVPAWDPCKSEPCGSTDTELTIGILQVFTIFVFGFTCHQNMFSVCNELHDPTPRRLNTVIIGAIGLALVLYLTAGSAGFAIFGDKVQSNILKNFPSTLYFSIMRVIISINVAFCVPLQMHPCRTSLINIIREIRQRLQPVRRAGEQKYLLIDQHGPNQNLESRSEDPKTSDLRKNEKSDAVEIWQPSSQTVSLLTLGLVMASYSIAMICSSLGVVLAVVGATGSTTISYILPGLLYLFLHKEWNTKKYFAVVLLVVGCLIVPTALTGIVLGQITH